MNTNMIESPSMQVEMVEMAESMSFAETIAALAMESADCYSEI